MLVFWGQIVGTGTRLRLASIGFHSLTANERKGDVGQVEHEERRARPPMEASAVEERDDEHRDWEKQGQVDAADGVGDVDTGAGAERGEG